MKTGGFVPREPANNGPVYQSPIKYEMKNPDSGQKVTPLKKMPTETTTTIRTVIPEAVTPDPLLGNGGSGEYFHHPLGKNYSFLLNELST